MTAALMSPFQQFAFFLLLASVVRASTGWELQPATGPDSPPDESAWVDQTRINTVTAMLADEPYAKGGALEWTRKIKGSAIDNAWFRKTVAIPPDAAGRTVWLEFPHLEGDGILWVNGKRVGEVFYPDWTLNITDFVEPGGNAEIQLYLTRAYHGVSRTLEDDRLAFYALRSHGRGGRKALGVLYEPRILLRGNPLWFEHVRTISHVADRMILVEARLGGDPAPGTILKGQILDENGHLYREISGIKARPGRNQIEVEFAGAETWDLNNPYLYTLELELVSDGKTIDSTSQKFGHREVEVRGNGVYVNGVRTSFRMHTPSHLNRGPDYVDDVAEAFGVNVFKEVINPLYFHGVDRSTSVQREDTLDHMDRKGYGAILSLPYLQAFRTPMPFDEDPLLREQYEAVLRRFIERLERHPSILGWTDAMNVLDYNTYAENLSPPHLGLSEIAGTDPLKKRGFEVGTAMVKAIDPTRFVYGHGSGNIGGELAGANIHMNFIPLAEKEAWHSEWANRGDKPWIHDEGGGAPYYPDYFLKRFDISGGRILSPSESEPAVTEFSAEFYGDDAYRSEPEALRRDPWIPGLQNMEKFGVSYFDRSSGTPLPPMMARYQIEANTRCNRAWRTWQVQGWFPWIGEWSYRWQNPHTGDPTVAAYRESMAPLLSYIGGSPDFFQRDCNYRTGEEVEKQVVVVFDGPEDAVTLDLRWELLSDKGKPVLEGPLEAKVARGSVAFLPLRFTAPAEEGACRLVLHVGGQSKPADSVSINLLAAPEPPESQSEFPENARVIGEVDPRFAQRLKAAGRLAAPVLVVGRNALKDMQELPFKAADVANGLRVIFFEQQPEDLLRLGLRSEIRGIRQSWLRESRHPLLRGIEPGHLQDWRGSSTLRPSYEPPKYWTHRPARVGMSPQRPARWGNHGNVATVMIETPERGAFLPLIECGFDLAYSPLIECRQGAGMVLFCQLDVTGRTAADPAASRILDNLVDTLCVRLPEADLAMDLAALPDPARKAFDALGFACSTGANAIQVRPLAEISGDLSGEGPALFAALEEGVPPPGFTRVPDATHAPVLESVTMDGVTIGPGLLRWRGPADIWVRHGQVTGAKGDIRFVGIPINTFSPPYSSLREKQQKRLSDRAVHEIHRRTLISLGARSSDEIAARLTRLVSFVPPGQNSHKVPLIDLNLETSKPIQIEGLGAERLLEALEEYHPKEWESSAVLVARRDQAHYGAAGETAYQDFAHLFEIGASSDNGVILRGSFELEKPQKVSILFKPDWWGRVKVNGETVIDLSNRSDGRAYGTATLDLGAGRHRVRAEIVSGTAGFDAVLYARTGDAGDADEIQAMLVRAVPASGLLPHNPADNLLYRSDKQDDQEPYLYKTW